MNALNGFEYHCNMQTSETFTYNLRCFETVTINKRLTTETPSTPSSRKFRSNRWSDRIGIEILEKFHKDNIQKAKLTRLFFLHSNNRRDSNSPVFISFFMTSEDIFLYSRSDLMALIDMPEIELESKHELSPR